MSALRFIFGMFFLSMLCVGAEPAAKAVLVEDGEIRLDGVLDEAVWKKAEKYGNFTVFRHPETRASEQTSFQVAASKTGLYFAFEVTDREMVSSYRNFDDAIDREDVIELFITADDPIPDDPNVHSCRQLLFSPAGVRADLSWLGGVSDRKWTSDWKVAVKRTADGFTAELYLPYYALEMVNVRVRRFHFNIARENTVGGGRRELSVWNPTPRFTDLNHFAALELPFTDFSAYRWQTGGLELKTVPSANGTMQVLTGTISGKTSGVISLQATARREGKIAAFSRGGVNIKDETPTPFTLPLQPGASGNYQVTITGRTKTGKVLHQVCELTLDAVPFKISLGNPVYRKSIFPDQEDKTVCVSIDYQTKEAKLLEGVKTVFTVTDAAGKTIAEGSRDSGAVRTFTADASKWLPGKYSVTVTSSGSAALSGTLSETIRVLAPPEKGNSVRLGRGREVYLNGKPFFPRGFLDGDNRNAEFFKEMSEAGYNVVHFYTLNQMKPETIRFILDEAQKHNLKVFCYPYYRCKVSSFGFRPVKSKVNAPSLLPEAWDWMKEMVNEVKNHPAFLGWYLSDEPKGAKFCAELRKVYRFLRELDPHHPVINLDMTAEGCIGKCEGYADIQILDMYPHPLTNGGWQRSMASVLHSMKLVNDGVAPHGAWLCPEAFKPGKAEYRSVTYREIRCLVFGGIVNGATGIVPYKIGDPRTRYYHNENNSGIFETPDMHLGYLKGIGPELKALEGVLLEPKRLPMESSSGHVIVMRKKHKGKEFIFAVNTMPDTLDCTLTGPGLPDGRYRVLGENRTVEVRNGKLNDSFVGYMTHIYTNDADYPAPVDIAALEGEIAKVDVIARKAAENLPPEPAKKKKAAKAKVRKK